MVRDSCNTAIINEIIKISVLYYSSSSINSLMIFMVSSAQGITDLFDFFFMSFGRLFFSGLLSCLSFYVSTNDKKNKNKKIEDPRTFPL